MFLQVGKSHIENGEYQDAVQWFERARTRMRPHGSRALLLVSLVSSLMALLKPFMNLQQISGWKFDDLDLTIRQSLCEAVFAAGRIKEAGESLLIMIHAMDKDTYMTRPVRSWVSGELCSLHFSPVNFIFLHRFLATISLRPRDKWQYKSPIAILYVSFARVGHLKIGRQFMERCLGFGTQSE